jgi:hypothetical protein
VDRAFRTKITPAALFFACSRSVYVAWLHVRAAAAVGLAVNAAAVIRPATATAAVVRIPCQYVLTVTSIDRTASKGA